MPLTCAAPAKINLGLHVLRKRDDGYHDVETVLHRIDWADEVTVEAADELSMTCSDPALPTDERNLCLQAARRLAEAFGVDRGAAIHLEKRVPYGAGLGGGSSDAAATIRLLADLWEIDASPEALREVAAGIGADVPFFLLDAPAALATGRGDELEPVTGAEHGAETGSETGAETGAEEAPFRLSDTGVAAVLVVVPPVEISTPDAYAAVTPDDVARPDLGPLVASGDLGLWRAELVNDFEPPIAERYPSVAAARALLHEHGADYVSLSGSGSAVYGLFTAPAQADAAQSTAHHDGYRTWIVDSVIGGLGD